MSHKYAEFLTPDNAVLAMIDHQTGLMVGLGDGTPTETKIMNEKRRNS